MAAIGLACAASALAASPDAIRRPNVVLFFIDTLRAQETHCLGFPRHTTDSLDAEARRGVLFETAISPSGWSLPSFSAIFTSLPAPAHGAQDVNHVLDPAMTTLADVYSAFGYRTAGFVAGGHLSAVFGLGKGFQTYQDRPHFGSFFHTVPAALAWLQKEDKRPFLLFVQGYDAHAPYRIPLGVAEMYDPGYKGVVHDCNLLRDGNMARIQNGVFHHVPEPEPPHPEPPRGLLAKFAWAKTGLLWLWATYSPPDNSGGAIEDIQLKPADLAHIAAHYDGAVTYADAWLGVFLENLERMGHGDDTIVIVAGDHGEELGEHGTFGHRRTLYECLIHVPLVISGPGIAKGRRVRDQVELLDLAPTLLDLCGIPPHQSHQGRTLRAYLDPAKAPPAPDPERIAFGSRSNVLSARTQRWHLLLEGENRQLFDLAADPTEQHDLSARERDLADRLASLARDWEERYRAEPRTGTAALTDEEKAMFRKQGYW